MTLVAAHVSHDAYSHKFNDEGHLFDADLFYENELGMATAQLHSPIMGWLCVAFDLTQVRHRPLLPDKVAYYGRKPVNNTIYLISIVGKFITFLSSPSLCTNLVNTNLSSTYDSYKCEYPLL